MSGSSFGLSAALFLAIAGGSGAPSAGAAGPAQQKADEYAVVAVSVFREPGFALPGAEVTLTPEPGAAAQSSKKKPKKLHGTTSPRGEYAFRVPPGPMHYTVTASAKHCNSQQKSVTVEGEERVDVTVTLAPSSK